MLPSSFGNPAPPCKVAITLPPGPRRIIDDGERGRLHVVTLRKPAAETRHPPVDLRRCRDILVVNLDFIGDWVLKRPSSRLYGVMPRAPA